MADRALRGTSIGSKSLETEDGVVFADRIEATYVVPLTGKTFTVPFSSEAEPPAVWESKTGQQALLQGASKPKDEKPSKPQRTHWDMLLERRSLEELQVLLDEQLKMLHEGRLREGVHYRRR
ncbi:RNA polymerase-binding protein RbpA [Winkia sp. UMB6473-AN360BR]|uniref:RNA polymerase-binding protein RbpA n=1 Tax=Winkia sp. UMB6473-AN360BR TaxID=3050611 RepID=UPI002556ECD7|nr:RNA polymerase-binding protein RbpA [Winkia sp. UMB6473-AN360BR]MDK8816200.1 RNA polymerase-binding protein RbpA [Winkia sp. UMB6473-AN360BR]